jgi:hypothetical protein
VAGTPVDRSLIGGVEVSLDRRTSGSLAFIAHDSRRRDPKSDDSSTGSGSGSGSGPGNDGSDALTFAIVGDTRPSSVDDTANYPTAIITKIFQDVAATPAQFVISTGDYQYASITGAEQQAQIDKYVPRDAGEVAARCYELLDMGKSDRELVIELRITPDLADYHRARWVDGGGASRVLNEAAWKAIEGVVGTFGSITELVDRIEELKARVDSLP